MTYQPVKTRDNDEYSDDSTLFDTGVEHSAQIKVPSRPRWLSTAKESFYTLAAITTIILLVLNLVTLRSTLQKQEILDAQHSNRIPAHLPRTYGRDRRYMTLDPQYDHLWNEWTADAQVMVPGDLPGEGLIQGAYSMFHQLHCLTSFRRAIQNARAGEEVGYDWTEDGHWPHCFDYLRNTILCWADNTIETAAVVKGRRQPFIDGTNMLRQCRSPESMYERMRRDEKALEKANEEDGLDHEQSHHHHWQPNSTSDHM